MILGYAWYIWLAAILAVLLTIEIKAHLAAIRAFWDRNTTVAERAMAEQLFSILPGVAHAALLWAEATFPEVAAAEQLASAVERVIGQLDKWKIVQKFESIVEDAVRTAQVHASQSGTSAAVHALYNPPPATKELPPAELTVTTEETVKATPRSTKK